MAAKRPFPAAGDTINIDSHPAGVSRLQCPLHSLECSLFAVREPLDISRSDRPGQPRRGGMPDSLENRSRVWLLRREVDHGIPVVGPSRLNFPAGSISGEGCANIKSGCSTVSGSCINVGTDIYWFKWRGTAKR